KYGFNLFECTVSYLRLPNFCIITDVSLTNDICAPGLESLLRSHNTLSPLSSVLARSQTGGLPATAQVTRILVSLAASQSCSVPSSMPTGLTSLFISDPYGLLNSLFTAPVIGSIMELDSPKERCCQRLNTKDVPRARRWLLVLASGPLSAFLCSFAPSDVSLLAGFPIPMRCHHVISGLGINPRNSSEMWVSLSNDVVTMYT
ncbi:hypothetical protein L9F63_015952, partial [Diploptera punctata]